MSFSGVFAFLVLIFVLLTYFRLRRASPPSSISNLSIEVNELMKNVTLNWVLPTTRTDGTPLVPSELLETVIEFSDDGGLSFPIQRGTPSPNTSLVFPNLSPGAYVFRVYVVDLQSPSEISEPVEIAVDIPVDLAAPSPVTDLTFDIVDAPAVPV